MPTPEEDQIRNYLHQLLDLTLQKKEIEKKAGRLERAVRALIDLVPEEEQQFRLLEALHEVAPPAGLTDAIRNQLIKAGSAKLTPKEARTQVAPLLLGHSNPLASVHTVLKRLEKSGQARLTEKNGEPAYEWVNPKQGTNSLWASRGLTRLRVQKPPDFK
jgi:hypothetical protein